MNGALSTRMRAAMLAVAACALAAGCGSSAGQAAAPASPPHRVSQAAATARPDASPSTSPSALPSVIAIPAPAPGLPQTRALPSAATPVFRAEMTDLWTAVVTGRPAAGAPAFFPLSAYKQVKAIADPAADWNARLFGDFRLDVGAARRLLGAGASTARLVRVIVPSADAAWIDPGVCYNAVGYWHVGGARLVYRQGGQVRSIGIASLISWRGQWYVVHFGAVLRTGAAGVVDQPAAGPGVPGPAGGC
ncbi:MAG TPA: hypothetical protein VFX25_41140 [Streptosporangiaceae bacterium]|nr:hypothetical protein [Streptosporangiaceae bacterium]